MLVERGAEWNFEYVLPLAPGQMAGDLELVVPLEIQMGWSESPVFFCLALETVWGVAKEQCADLMGLLPPYPLEEMMLTRDRCPPDKVVQPCGEFLNMLEVYVDKFCAMAQSGNSEKLRYVSWALLHSIHEVFPPPDVSSLGGEDIISVKKIKAGKGVY